MWCAIEKQLIASFTATSWSSQKGNIPFHYYICYSVMWANIIALQIISLLHNNNKLGKEDDGEEE